MKILLIEDDQWFSYTVVKVLEKEGWQTAVAPDGAEGIDMIDDFEPDAVLLDVMLPSSSAPTLLNELQSHTDLADVPIVLCSSVNTESLRHYGVRSVLDKAKTSPQDIVKALKYAVQ
jgi:twitching motility two-component system response regulator PilH